MKTIDARCAQTAQAPIGSRPELPPLDLRNATELHWAEGPDHLLVLAGWPSPAVGAISWPDRTMVWSRELPAQSGLCQWDCSGAALFFDSDRDELFLLDHRDGVRRHAARLPDLGICELSTASCHADDGISILTSSHYVELDPALRLRASVALGRLPQTVAFMSRGAFGPPRAHDDQGRVLVYQEGLVFLDLDRPQTATVVDTRTVREFGQKPFDPVPNPIDPLNKFTLVDPESPESLGRVNFPTFSIGACVWADPLLFLFGGPHSGVVLVLNLVSLRTAVYYAPSFRAHNHRPTLQQLSPHHFVLEGSYHSAGEFRFEPPASDIVAPRLEARVTQFDLGAFTYATPFSAFLVSRGRLTERSLVEIPSNAAYERLPMVALEDPDAPTLIPTEVSL